MLKIVQPKIIRTKEAGIETQNRCFTREKEVFEQRSKPQFL